MSSTKGNFQEKRKNKSQPDTQNVADIVFIIYISLTKKVRRNSSKVREGMQLLLYSGVASTNFALYPSVFHLNKHFLPKTKNRLGLQPILTNGSSKCCNLHTFLCCFFTVNLLTFCMFINDSCFNMDTNTNPELIPHRIVCAFDFSPS